MKILYVNHYGKTISGAERVMLNLASELMKRPGVELEALCPAGVLKDELEALGTPVTAAEFVKPKRTADPAFWGSAAAAGAGVWRKLFSLLRNGRFDVLFSNSYVGHLYSCLPARAAGVKTVFHSHDMLKPLEVNRWAVRFASKNADSVIAVSDAVRDNFIGLGAEPAKIVTVLNGIDQAAFDRRATAGLEKPLPRKTDDELFVTIVGQVGFLKGQHTFVEAAIEILRTRKYQVKFLLVGDVMDRTEKNYMEELRGKALESGVGDGLVFTGYRTDVPAVLTASDILVHASASLDSCPMAVIEYLYSGKPAVASRIGGVPELITDGENGLLFEPGDAEGLRSVIVRLLEDPGLREKLGAAARRRALARHSLKAQVDAVMAVLNTVA